MSLDVGEDYIDAGATASDNLDGDITASIVALNSVNSQVAGLYHVTYRVTDSSGIRAEQVIREVNVVGGLDGFDKNPPVITLVGSPQVFVCCEDGYVELGATAWDEEDGDITSKIVIVSTVPPGCCPPLGDYIVTYNVKDSSGNSAIEVIRNVNVNLG